MSTARFELLMVNQLTSGNDNKDAKINGSRMCHMLREEFERMFYGASTAKRPLAPESHNEWQSQSYRRVIYSEHEDKHIKRHCVT